MDNGFDWIPFYMEFADRLLDYKNDRGSLLNILRDVYNDAGLNSPFHERDESPYSDICPFTVFGSFNKADSKRNILRYIKKHFNLKSNMPKSFDGIPALSNQEWYFFKNKNERNENDIDNLWNLFEKGLQLSKNVNKENEDEFVKSYNRVVNMKGIKWRITIALYWIRPYCFVAFDKSLKSYIKDSCNPFNFNEKLYNKVKNDNRFDGFEYLESIEYIKTNMINTIIECTNFPKLLKYTLNIGKINSNNSYNEGNIISNNDNGIEENDYNFLPESTVDRNYWVYSPGEKASMWEDFYNDGIMAIKWDKLAQLSSFNTNEQILSELKRVYPSNNEPTNGALCLWQFSHEMKVGDVVFAKNGVNKLVGRGIVESDYEYDVLRSSYKHIRKVKWEKCNYTFEDKFAVKTLTKITQYTDYLNKILKLFDNPKIYNVEQNDEYVFDEYNKEDFLKDVYISNDDYDTLIDLLDAKFNVILQGPPGVGKSYCAKRLAYSIMGEKDDGRVESVQFHQSYSYEDFIQGYRPKNGSFVLDNGVFYDFCKRAEKDPNNDYFFIIDEINRGNISKIFGELLMLIEKDHRGEKVKLLYSKESFNVPKNIRIIGMMNTSDRSLAMIDYALRRRFAFYDMVPAFSNEKFKVFIRVKNSNKLDKLISTVESLNKKISEDENLGDGFKVGHSYFCIDDMFTDSRLRSIVEYELIPLIKEYWFDEPSNVKEWSEKLREAIK